MNAAAMNALQEALNTITNRTRGVEEAAIPAATARGLLRGYAERWKTSDWKFVAVEEEFLLPIINPDTRKRSRTFRHAGKFDGVAEYLGKRYLAEYKTCSEDISDPNGTYWRRLEIDHQVSGYMLAQWQMGNKLDGTFYDVTRKPGIRPKQVSKGERRENPEEFEERLYQDTMERPEWYFQRKTLYRMDSQILDFARELWDIADEIRLARLHNRHYKNSHACLQYGVPCAYLGICSGHDSADSPKWKKKGRVHTELPLIEDDGRDVLTHSRILTFKTCRRKAQLKYEIGLERVDREESDALFFGSLWHAALEQFHKPEAAVVNGGELKGQTSGFSFPVPI